MRINPRLRLVILLAVSTSFLLPVRSWAACGGKSCSAGSSAACGYSPKRQPVVVSSGGSTITAQRAFWANQMQAAANAAAKRAETLRRKAIANQKLWDIAFAAEASGDLQGATQVYRDLALARPATSVTKLAQERLADLQGQADRKFQAIEDQLKQISGIGTALRRVELDEEMVIHLFGELDSLALEYAGVATVDSRIQSRLNGLRKVPQFAAVLQEPAASDLWKLGQGYEGNQQRCCAVQVYEQAAALAPAPSARLAIARLAILKKDEKVVAEARLCQNLQLCHEKFRHAQAIRASNPGRAREYLAEIIELAPADTSIYLAAREQIAMLP